MFSEDERRELLDVVASEDLRRDMRALARHAAAVSVDLDTYIVFATAVARLGNHAHRPFRRMRDTYMRI